METPAPASSSENTQNPSTARPVIGIVTHPCIPECGHNPCPCEHQCSLTESFIPASYVKFVHSADGDADVVPLIYNEDRNLLDKKLALVDGVVFTGGFSIKKKTYFETIKYVYEHVKKENIPLFAICLGFQMLFKLENEDNDRILEKFDEEQTEYKKLFLPNKKDFRSDVALPKGSLFHGLDPDVTNKLSTRRIAPHYHKRYLSRENFQDCKPLSDFFNVLSTSVAGHSPKEVEYVSTVQAKNHPNIIGTQWHPEIAIKSTKALVAQALAKHVADYFVRKAREYRQARAKQFDDERTHPDDGTLTDVTQKVYHFDLNDGAVGFQL